MPNALAQSGASFPFQSRQNHEKSVKHKQRIEELAKQKREAQFQGARDEEDLKRQLREIDQVRCLPLGETHSSISLPC